MGAKEQKEIYSNTKFFHSEVLFFSCFLGLFPLN